jgi:WD40 repeat protein
MKGSLVLAAWLAGTALLAAEKSPPAIGYAPLPKGAWACLGSPRFIPPGWVSSLAFSRNSRLLAVASNPTGGNAVDIWDVSTGREVSSLRGVQSRGMTPHLHFSADGKELLFGGFSTVRIYDIASRKERLRFKAHDNLITGLALSRDGKRIVTSSQDGTIRVWDFATGKEIRRISCDAPGISLAPDDRTLATAGEDVLIWDVETGKRLGGIGPKRSPGSRGFNSVRFSPDGKTLAVVDHPTVILCDARTGKERQRLKRNEVFWVWFSIAFSPDSKWLITGGSGYRQPHPINKDFVVELKLWDVGTGKEERSFAAPQGKLESFAIAPDGKTIAVANSPFDVRVFDVASGRESSRFAGHSGRVTGLAFTPDGQALWSAGADATVRVWNPARLTERAVLRKHTKEVKTIALAPDGKTLVSCGRDGVVCLWDTTTQRAIGSHAFPGEVWSAAFSADGKALATGHAGEDGHLRLWDWRTGKVLSRRKDLPAARCLAFAPDGKTLAVSNSSTIFVRVAATGNIRRQIPSRHHGFVTGLIYLPDGRLVSAGGGDRLSGSSVHLWDVLTKKQLDVIGLAVRARSSTMTLSPDNRFVAGAFDGTIQVWEMNTRRQVCEFTGHRGDVTALAFHPDGWTLASGGIDGAILFWDLSGGRAARDAGKRLTPADLDRLWKDLVNEESPSTAQRAVWALALSPKQGTPFLARRIRPIPAVAPKRMAQLIAGLDADVFADREKAMRELADLGEVAVPHVRRALEGAPSPELSRRAGRLLEPFEKPVLSLAALQGLRGIEALERAATPEAKQVLRSLADGAPEARLTREAKAALERLARQGK